MEDISKLVERLEGVVFDINHKLQGHEIQLVQLDEDVLNMFCSHKGMTTIVMYVISTEVQPLQASGKEKC